MGLFFRKRRGAPSGSRRKASSVVNYFRIAPDYEIVEGLLVNMGIMAALVAGLGISIVFTIPREEFYQADILKLSADNLMFRQHFAPNNTYDQCSGHIDAGSRPQRDTGRGYFKKLCNSENIVDARKIAASISVDDFILWVEEHYFDVTTRPRGDLFCLASQIVAVFGFLNVLFMMTVLFLSVYLNVSLALSKSRDNKAELDRWWWPIGFVLTFLGYILLLVGMYFFMDCLEGVVAVRFPWRAQRGMWAIVVKDIFCWFTLLCLPLCTLGHFAWVRYYMVQHDNKADGSDDMKEDSPETQVVLMGRKVGEAAENNLVSICSRLQQIDITFAEKYSKQFAAQHIDAEQIGQLTKEDLENLLGIPLGHALQIWSHFQQNAR